MNLNELLTASVLYPSGSEKACAAFLFEMKWPSGFSCPRCEHPQYYLTSTRRLPLYECRLCRHQTSLLSGTIFEGSKTELTKWMKALLLIATDRGISAVRLSKVIEVTYKTAWLILHKIRYAISSADMHTLLFGTVRVNAAVYGRPHLTSHHFHSSEQPFFVGASSLEAETTDSQYVKMKLISQQHLSHNRSLPIATKAFAQNEISPNAEDVVFVTSRYSSQRFTHLHRLANQACRWMNSTFNGLSRKHLQAYLDEFCYRLNNLAASESPILHLTHTCLRTIRITYKQLVQLGSVAH